MGKKIKEEERIEKIIRGLLRLPGNRRCINCNSLGPQYVCTTFRTFVCTNCSGVHREFTHRVKSVSMAKFTADEVEALQAGGNERARQIYFRTWDYQRHSFPDSNNLQRLRDFIRHIYVEKKYTGERGDHGPPRLGLTEKEEISPFRSVPQSPHHEDKIERGKSLSDLWKNDQKVMKDFFEDKAIESPKSESNRPSGASAWKSEERSFRSYLDERISRGSPRFTGKNEERNLKQYFEERKSPRHYAESSKPKKSPIRFEIVDDRLRDDEGRRYNVGRRSVDSWKRGKSSDNTAQNQKSAPSSPQVLAEKDQVAASSSQDSGEKNQVDQKKESESVTERNQVEQKKENDSLIDLLSDSQPPDAEAAQDKQLVPSSSYSANQDALHPEKEKSTLASDPNSLEALLFGFPSPDIPSADNTDEVQNSINDRSSRTEDNSLALSVLSAAPSQQIQTLPENVGASSTNVNQNVPVQSPNVNLFSAAPDTKSDSSLTLYNGQQLSAVQQYQPSSFPAAEQNTSKFSTLDNQLQASSHGQTAQEPFNGFIKKSTEAVSSPAEDMSAIVRSQSLPEETNTSQRKEIPADLFTTRFSPVPQQYMGWPPGPAQNMGYGMHYYPRAMFMPAIPSSAKSTNPFDVNSEPPRVQPPQFPSMTPLQGVLPDVAVPRAIMPTPSFNSQTQGIMQPQSTFYASGMAPNPAAFASIVSSSPYMGQQLQNSMPPSGLPGFNDLGNSNGAALGPSIASEETNGIFTAPTSKGGNPFG